MTGPPGPDGRYVLPGNRWDLLPAGIGEPPTVSVVVPHYDAQRQLDLVLAGLAGQTYPASRLQVVVADDGSARPPRVPPGVVLVRQDDRGFRAAAARNLGAGAADGEVLCFLDGDTVPEPGYVRTAVRIPALTADGLVVGRRRHADLSGLTPAGVADWFAGRAAPPPVLPEPAWLADGYRGSRNLLDVDDRSYRYVISAVLTCARDLFDAVGGFDPSFTGYGGEDWDLAHRAFTAGAVLAHEPAAVAWHDGPDWAGRSGSAARGRQQKNAETLELARRIPDPELRGPGLWGGVPRVAVSLAGGAPLAAWVLSARSLLAAADDLAIWTDPATAAACADPRVHPAPVPGHVDARARTRLEVLAPVLVTAPRLADLLDRVAAPGPGRVTTSDGRVVATASRAHHRSARHGADLAALFGTAAVAPFDPVDGDPDLSRLLPRLRARG